MLVRVHIISDFSSYLLLDLYIEHKERASRISKLKKNVYPTHLISLSILFDMLSIFRCWVPWRMPRVNTGIVLNDRSISCNKTVVPYWKLLWAWCLTRSSKDLMEWLQICCLHSKINDSDCRRTWLMYWSFKSLGR